MYLGKVPLMFELSLGSAGVAEGALCVLLHPWSTTSIHV